MRVAKETLQRKGIDFAFEHVMSCEIEPYKQSFIARNNPGVLLFPDIAALGATSRGEKATTAFGGMAGVPSAKMIVAGTSCKDFSNLKGKDRKSIEAMGTSGETFIGFVNLLFEQRYPIGILENLKGAEWAKMGHYSMLARVKRSPTVCIL
jgi:site-specific DNA-cytosine methylase